ncbi:hypothetical protein HJC23_005646 [Cyclotella cryptica]|uniref:DnaJ homolog subfamily C member 2 n=1 Tax=Cyclotella cryptica TaxID=29204 RepID=A0ABD3PZJ9_9STRA|eukprot:CCRYP_010534-RA/>CCRYP_010534-RA protein AED:0.01 eAED:0.01 QI:192/1/1/1/1/1/2/790/657
MSTSEFVITPISPLDWPSTLLTGQIQRAGRSYLAYESRLLNRRHFLHSSSFYQQQQNGTASSASLTSAQAVEEKKKEYDLLAMSERKLKKLSYYQVLQRDLPMHASADDIRKAYHKACLKYHPDKTGRGEEDEVFLLVKAAFDTLSDPTKRRSYDSTVDFDENIPKEGVDEADFYNEYGPVFERNLRFASFNDPARQATAKTDDISSPLVKKKGKKNKGGKKSNSSNDLSSQTKETCPSLGDDSTPLSEVHAFYDFWIHFESWRDFTLKATKETEHDVEAADSRDEKRWMKQEIDRKVKKMKKEEMARINLLVERAMAADPRLKRERERERKEKAAKEEARKKLEEEKAELERKEREAREAEEKKKAEVVAKEKANDKKLKEQQKKQLRKAKQLFRKLTMTAYQAAIPNNESTGKDAVWDDLEQMNDDIELLCDKLSSVELNALSEVLGGSAAVEEDGNAPICVDALVEVRQCAQETAAGAERQSLLAIKERQEARKLAAEKAREAKLARASAPWTKDELSALAKAVKKYPPGGSNRWDAVALFINNQCKMPDPRSKEECIEKYNQIAASAASPSAQISSSNVKDASAETDRDGGSGANEPWTEEQDTLLQEMLRKYPADMDKNERWKAIAKGVPGRSKKECVERFKAIREAVRQKG